MAYEVAIFEAGGTPDVYFISCFTKGVIQREIQLNKKSKNSSKNADHSWSLSCGPKRFPNKAMALAAQKATLDSLIAAGAIILSESKFRFRYTSSPCSHL